MSPDDRSDRSQGEALYLPYFEAAESAAHAVLPRPAVEMSTDFLRCHSSLYQLQSSQSSKLIGG